MNTTTRAQPEKKEKRKGLLPMTLFELLTTIISIAGFAGVVYGLLSTESAVRTDTYLKTYGWTLDIDKAMVDNPTVRPYLAGDAPKELPPAFTDSQRVYATADYMLDVFDAVLRNKSYFEKNKDAKKLWVESIQVYFLNSSILTRRFKDNESEYSSELVACFVHRFELKARVRRPQ